MYIVSFSSRVLDPVLSFAFTFTTVLPDRYDSLTMYYDKYLLYIVWANEKTAHSTLVPNFLQLIILMYLFHL